MNIEQALQRLQLADVQMLPLAELQTDNTFQPREVRMVPFREQTGVERRSEDHISVMRLALEAAQSTELEPVLVADVQGGLYLVDGHHRLTAYRRAQRRTIPARVMPMDRAKAVLVSKLVNCTGRALEMHVAQRLDAAWQYVAAVTKHGALSLPARESTRTVGVLFSVSHSTVARMLRKLPEVNPRDWSTAALDPGTGFPRWRYVREAGAGWQDMKEKLDVEQLTQHEAEKFARKVGALIEKTSPEAVRRAWQMLGIEAQLEAVNEDTKDFAADTAESADF